MTSEEYYAHEQLLLKDIPIEFHAAFSYYAYEEGHSGGYEECYSHLSNLISMIKEPLEKYTNRILNEVN